LQRLVNMITRENNGYRPDNEMTDATPRTDALAAQACAFAAARTRSRRASSATCSRNRPKARLRSD